MKKLHFILPAIVLCVLFSGGCGDSKSKQPSAQTTAITLNVFAAASLTETIGEIARMYTAANPHITFSFNFDSSGKLQTQIENGAEADLFFSAGQKQMNALADGGYINADTRKDLLVNKIALIVPKGSTQGITSFDDCTTKKVTHISLGNASVPVGQYSEEIFRHLGVWDKLSAKISFANNVREVLAQVESGSVECGVVYTTDAAVSDRVEIAAYAPEGSHAPAIYPAAVLKNAANSAAAKAFLDYSGSPEATAVFEKAGFKTVKNN